MSRPYVLRKGWLEKLPEYERNAKRVNLAAGEEPCARCGKPLKPNEAFWVEMLIGGEILTPGDPRSGVWNESQGGWPLGETCYRKLVGPPGQYRWPWQNGPAEGPGDPRMNDDPRAHP